MREHPLKAVGFTALFTIIASFMGFVEQLFWPGLISYACAIGMLVLCFWLDKKLISLLLALSLLVTKAEAAPKPDTGLGAGCAIAVVVIVVGGVCIYKVSRFCQRRFPPKNTNSPPRDFTVTGAAVGDFGASWDYGSAGSCDCSGELPAPALAEWPNEATTVALNITAGPTLEMTIGMVRGEPQTFLEYQDEVVSQGLFISLQGGGGQHFAHNGISCEPELVPITFNEQTKTICYWGGQGLIKQVIVERSVDLLEWTEFLRTQVAEGTRLQIVDTTQVGRMFYRTRLEENP